MRFFQFKSVVLATSLLVAAGFIAISPDPAAHGQSNISGDVVGTVMDSSGAVLTNAAVTLKNEDTGATSISTTSDTGAYRFPLLKPGRYSVSVSMAGFQPSKLSLIVATGQITQGDVRMAVGQGSQTVEVTAEGAMLHTDNAQLSTSFEMEQIQALPNPGNDLTFVAQTAPGAVMNTQSGYGNFSVFGLPGTSNTYTVNGGYENDPYLNVNNSGATNLLLGNNDISEVSVITNAYDAAYGGLGGAQVNEISRSGSNKFHGNAAYWWNGRVMNANSWFNKNSGSPRSFDNVNQWAASVGGPIRRDKTFFFFNYEGLRVVLPTESPVYAPSAQYEASAMAAANALGEGAIYSKIFSVYNNAPGYKNATPYDDSNPDAGTPATGDFVQFNGTAGNFTHEYLMSGRIDQILGSKDNLYGHFKLDKGLQATFTSLLDPVYNVNSAQPQYEGQLNETHTFNPSATNQFLFAATYYRAIFSNANQSKGNANFPGSLVFLGGVLGGSPATFSGWPGGENFDFPQGRNVTGYQFSDDVSWTRGRHSLKFGWTMRRDDVTDYSPSVRAVTPELYSTDAAFKSGYLTRYRQSFPTRPSQPVALYTMGWYVQDQWKIAPSLTLTAGLRFEHDSNPICVTNCFADLSSDFFNAAATTTTSTPYNKIINVGRHQAFNDLQMLSYEPRIGVAYQPFGPNSKSTVRAGFGIFSDSFPAQIAGSLLNNAPNNVQFYLKGGHYLVDPTLPGSGAAAATSSDAAFVAGFNSGASFDQLSTSAPGFVPPAFTTAARSIKYPTYEEYSLAVEQELPGRVVLSASYVGNHGYHEPVVDGGVNAYGFDTLPASAPSDNLGQVNRVYSGASSNYNGVVVSAARRGRILTAQLNYAYSHALDEISNGGFDAFGANPVNPFNPYDLHQNYGNSDYDIRHYVSGSYVINIPHFGGPKVLTEGWTFAGTVFHSTGLPYSYIDSNTPNNYAGSILGMQTQKGGFDTHCGGGSHAGLVGTPCNSASFFAPATAFGQQHRNQLFGPNYTDSDLDAVKSIKLPKWESANVKLGVQFFNVFNHPNFGQPLNDVSSDGLGTIQSTVNPPTSILGSFLGGDASPRLIQLKANLTF